MLRRVTQSTVHKMAAGPRAQSRGLRATPAAAFLFRDLEDVVQDGRILQTEHGAVESRRYLVRADGCGFSVQHEIYHKGQPVRLEFRNHVSAIMVTRGEGRLQLFDSHDQPIPRHHHALGAGSFFALNASEPAEIVADSDELHVISVMNPPLAGAEQRDSTTGIFPVTDHDGIERDEFDHASVRRLCEPPESLKGGSSPMKDDPLF